MHGSVLLYTAPITLTKQSLILSLLPKHFPRGLYMANSTVMRVAMLMLIILSAEMINLEAVSYRGVESIPKRIHSSTLLQRLSYHISNRNVTDASSSRLSPGGPDPEHH
ncbi:hypothetical protein SADUNF_Sadunf11G0040600 [Salix dunnii]|uniref:Uncharacterized protein n=1 Tax=Salix dunnii TaxID=1413687 RepID=A0A835MMV4_9ROSI|nr:hypothetical protein SADUNF_Sadunf11G0040600 [Salix dunnii]